MSGRIPPWLIPPVPKKRHLQKLGRELAEMGVHTVCQSAKCPNLGECFSRRTATFMLMGEVCTRDCRFCAVAHGRPQPLDSGEPERVAKAAKRLELRYVVVTSVTRDDLSDGGAGHFSRTVTTLRDFLPGSRVEVLVPDFRGKAECVERVVEAGPDVFGHNVETAPRLYHSIRPQADYRRSLEVLRRAGEGLPATVTKSGFMLGLGEGRSEVLSLLADLREVGVRAVTIGQYLPPSREHARVVEYVAPQVFAEYGQLAREMGFAHVSSGPLVRSSYRAEELLVHLRCTNQGVAPEAPPTDFRPKK